MTPNGIWKISTQPGELQLSAAIAKQELITAPRWSGTISCSWGASKPLILASGWAGVASPSWRKIPALEETSFKRPENSKKKDGKFINAAGGESSVSWQASNCCARGKRPRGSNSGPSQPCSASHHPGGKFCTSRIQQPGSVCRCPTQEGRVYEVLLRVLWMPKGHSGGSSPPHPKLTTVLCLCLHPSASLSSPHQQRVHRDINMCSDSLQLSGDSLALIQEDLG